ncbi:uncharacterized protein EDB91DRAFT_1076431 [Suillus paluster]|uniref:uncharacterized protein n=1 Tax=Suillus paluster TaxID=48578 RepID=UPI001B870A7A|nr:uncharacterized protein EDB91DRAFT_1076431 [Suillus paluster]KAG1756385.1 hypothetical protein EDB91DRAFT_1076431 [Suillus paluster]
MAVAAGPSHIIADDSSANSEPQAPVPIAGPDKHTEFDAGNEGVQSPVLSDASMTSNPGPNIPHQPAVDIECPQEFKTKFHPCSGHETLYQRFKEFSVTPERQAPPVDEVPWRPFQSRRDFEFSEITLDAALNKAQGDTQVTLKNEAGLRTALDNAAAELMPFTKHEIKVPYKKEQQVFEVHMRPLWDWALDLLDNPLLAPHFIWDAQHIYKHNDMDFEHFFNEPWTGDWWWEIQIDGEASEHGKPGYINLKRVIWHEAFTKLLVNLKQYSKTGYLYMCYNKIMHWLFPVILILSTDYKEHVQCKCLCPVCLVPHEELSNLSKTFAIRSAKDAQAALNVYRCSKTQGEELLKALGLHAVALSHNVLWLIEHSDPHDAMSVDRLHTVHGGMGGKHLLGKLKIILGDVGCETLAAVEKFVEKFPRWCDLTHFTTIIHVTFTDGNKKRDLVMQVFYAALPILTHKASPEGYYLLHVICSYLQLDSLIGLDVHTERTLAMLDAEFLVFDAALKIILSLFIESSLLTKSQDYVEYATTSSVEGYHKESPLKAAYLFRSNGKDVAKQILRVDHHKCTSLLLRGLVDTLDEQCHLQALGDAADGDDISHITFDGHIKLGFCRKFSDFVNTLLPTYGYQLMRWVTIPADFQIYEHRYLKVNYENTVDWRQSTDHLRLLQKGPSLFGSY